MLKKLIMLMLVLAIAGAAFAAPASTVTGKITAIADGKVTISLDGDKPAWVKKNGFVKFVKANGKILDVTKGTPIVITVKTSKASTMKVGDAISFQKGKAMAGC